jgi:hypothetical protein
MSSTAENTVLTSADGYDCSQMIFSEPSSGTIPDSKPKIEYKRINISTRNKDGSTGELIIPTERLFSFGVSENTSQETGKVNGYTFPICLWGRDNPTSEEKTWTDTFNKIVNKCVDHLVDKKEEIDRFELTKADLTKTKGGLNPLYWKREKYTNPKGKTVLRIVPGTGPTLYTKLIYSKKHDKFLSQFFNTDDDSMNALDLMGKYCYTKAAIKIESIFIGSRISLQIKLYEAVVEPMLSGMKRLLRPKAQSKVIEYSNTGNSNLNDIHEDSEDSDGSLIDSEEEDEKPTKKVIRKVKKVSK